MVYAATRRAPWRGSLTGIKFFSTTVVLGCATVLLASIAAPGAAAFLATPAFRVLLGVLAAAATAKLGGELYLLGHARDQRHSPLKHVALLLTGELRGRTAARFAAGALGGLLLPGMLWGATARSPAVLAGGAAMFLACLAGELLERHLFFVASPASKMPGSAG
jgi:DMSO reductase anchor subunit